MLQQYIIGAAAWMLNNLKAFTKETLLNYLACNATTVYHIMLQQYIIRAPILNYGS